MGWLENLYGFVYGVTPQHQSAIITTPVQQQPQPQPQQTQAPSQLAQANPIQYVQTGINYVGTQVSGGINYGSQVVSSGVQRITSNPIVIAAAAPLAATPMMVPMTAGITIGRGIVTGVQNIISPQPTIQAPIGNTTINTGRGVGDGITKIATAPMSGMTFFVAAGDVAQTSIKEAKAVYDPVGGGVGFYQVPQSQQELGFTRIYGFVTSSGSSGALQSGKFSTKPLTPVVYTQEGAMTTLDPQYADPAGAAVVLANPQDFSRVGAEVYGGYVQPLDGRTVQSTGVTMGRYPTESGNLANLVDPFGPNQPKGNFSEVPWKINYANSPVIQSINTKGEMSPITPAGMQSIGMQPVMMEVKRPFVSANAPSMGATGFDEASAKRPFVSVNAPAQTPTNEWKLQSPVGGLIGLQLWGDKKDEVIKGAAASVIDFTTGMVGWTPMRDHTEIVDPRMVAFRTENERMKATSTPEEYNAFLQKSFESGVLVKPVTSATFVENPQMTYAYGEYTKWGQGVGDSIKKTLGFNQAQLDAYQYQVETKGNIVDQVVYGTGYIFSSNPEKILTAYGSGVAMVFGGEVVAGMYANSALAARAGTFALAHPTIARGATLATQIAIPTVLLGMTAWGATEGGTASPQRTTVNLGKMLPELVGVTAGGMTAYGAVRSGRIGLKTEEVSVFGRMSEKPKVKGRDATPYEGTVIRITPEMMTPEMVKGLRPDIATTSPKAPFAPNNPSNAMAFIQTPKLGEKGLGTINRFVDVAGTRVEISQHGTLLFGEETSALPGIKARMVELTARDLELNAPGPEPYWRTVSEGPAWKKASKVLDMDPVDSTGGIFSQPDIRDLRTPVKSDAYMFIEGLKKADIEAGRSAGFDIPPLNERMPDSGWTLLDMDTTPRNPAIRGELTIPGESVSRAGMPEKINPWAERLGVRAEPITSRPLGGLEMPSGVSPGARMMVVNPEIMSGTRAKNTFSSVDAVMEQNMKFEAFNKAAKQGRVDAVVQAPDFAEPIKINKDVGAIFDTILESEKRPQGITTTPKWKPKEELSPMDNPRPVDMGLGQMKPDRLSLYIEENRRAVEAEGPAPDITKLGPAQTYDQRLEMKMLGAKLNIGLENTPWAGVKMGRVIFEPTSETLVKYRMSNIGKTEHMLKQDLVTINTPVEIARQTSGQTQIQELIQGQRQKDMQDTLGASITITELRKVTRLDTFTESMTELRIKQDLRKEQRQDQFVSLINEPQQPVPQRFAKPYPEKGKPERPWVPTEVVPTKEVPERPWVPTDRTPNKPIIPIEVPPPFVIPGGSLPGGGSPSGYGLRGATSWTSKNPVGADLMKATRGSMPNFKALGKKMKGFKLPKF